MENKETGLEAAEYEVKVLRQQLSSSALRIEELEKQLEDTISRLRQTAKLANQYHIEVETTRSQLSASQQEARAFRKVLEYIREHGRTATSYGIEYNALGKKAADILIKYPQPSTNTDNNG